MQRVIGIAENAEALLNRDGEFCKLLLRIPHAAVIEGQAATRRSVAI